MMIKPIVLLSSALTLGIVCPMSQAETALPPNTPTNINDANTGAEPRAESIPPLDVQQNSEEASKLSGNPNTQPIKEETASSEPVGDNHPESDPEKKSAGLIEEKPKQTPPHLLGDPEVSELEKNKQLLILKNSMEGEQLKEENSDLLSRLQKLRWEKELLEEQLAFARLKKEVADESIEAKHQALLIQLTRESELAAAREAKLNSELATQRAQWELKNQKLQEELDAIRLWDEHNAYVNKQPQYLQNPVLNDGTLVISDRRIGLSGPILHETADYISDRLNYYNNKDESLPIFLVIDSSPGGSAMAGYKIMRALDSSKAPVYVVVKSFAASMAAIITTTAKHSYAYPNAIIMHHQPVATLFLVSLNLTEQKEFYEDSKKWWELMMGPVAQKMGISGDELIKQMYENVSHGNWSEFATEAQKLKWVDHLINRIHETALLLDPDADVGEHGDYGAPPAPHDTVNSEGRSVMYLPRLPPKDPYFIYNPDRYYQVR
ncbi:MAG: ATP-dependent Clp protease proteolytic subunit [bacterium]